MTAILKQLPFEEHDDEVSYGRDRFPVRPYQIIVWVSISARSVLELPPQAPRFPAILDTGHNHNFSINARNLRGWAAIPAESLRCIGQIAESGRTIPLREARVWLYRNRPGKRDWSRDGEPLRLQMDEGIAVYGEELGEPRLPLLGLRALVRNKLHLTIDTERRQVHLRTPGFRTKLLRWFS